MKTIYYTFVTVTLFVLYSCSGNDIKTNDGASIEKIYNTQPDSSIVLQLDSIFTINFDPNFNVAFQDFTPVIFAFDNDSNIFMSNTKRICKFDKKGNFLNIFGEQGQGPGEISSTIISIFISDTCLFAYEVSKSLVHKFNTSCEFIESIPVDNTYYQFIPQKDNSFLALNYNYDFDRKNKLISIIKLDSTFKESTKLYSFNSELSKEGFPYDKGVKIHSGSELYLVYKDKNKYHYDCFSLDKYEIDSIEIKQSISKFFSKDGFSDKKMKDIKEKYRRHFPQFKNSLKEKYYLWNEELGLSIPILDSFLDSKGYLWIQTSANDSLTYNFDIFKDGLLRNSFRYTSEENTIVYFNLHNDILFELIIDRENDKMILIAKRIRYEQLA
ncbi:MAG: hypothetical protein JXR48_03210 [Candidatus Delongbacteria bacterium]|nr:hypothetical protein [Candidatus Delongbacteria bacterium]MBN2833956.1 hypothetical protein [Candidatus Delongbacteria bacterium]